MLVENGVMKPFLLKIVWQKSRTAIIVKHSSFISCVNVVQFKKAKKRALSFTFMIMFARNLDLHGIRSDTVKLVSYTCVIDGH